MASQENLNAESPIEAPAVSVVTNTHDAASHADSASPESKAADFTPADFDVVIANAQPAIVGANPLRHTSVDEWAELLTKPVPAPAHQNAKSAKRGQMGSLHTASVAAVAATVAIATLSGSVSGAAEVELLAESAIVEAHAIAIDVYSGDVLLGRSDVAASRASSRVGLTDVLGDTLEFADTETLDAAINALTAAELLLVSERRATPELIDEIQAARTDLREALDVLQAISEGDYDRAVEVLLALSAYEPEASVELADDAAEPVAIDVFGLAVAEPAPAESDLAVQTVPDAAAQEVAEVSDDYELALPQDPAEIAEIADEIIRNATERVENAVLEAEFPIPVMEPRALTAAEAISVLAAEAQADGARLHELYAYSTAGEANGRLPEHLLQNLSWLPNHMLRPDAATQLERLNEAYRLEFGMDMPISSTYRTFAGQVQARARSGMWAATPGTSNHGWGIAVDFTGGINRFGTPQHRWMQENAPAFGWIHPEWARRGGRLPEPWHWEFWGTPDPVTGEPISPGILRGTENNAPGEFTPSDSIWHP